MSFFIWPNINIVFHEPNYVVQPLTYSTSVNTFPSPSIRVVGGKRESFKTPIAPSLSQVNMIVLGKELGVPKPFGPKVDGRCALEAEMNSLMEPLGLSCTYIDNFASYHKQLGEVHCGSNVRRKPFALKWWNLEM